MGDGNLLLYLNLCGELFYIVAHRMKSQGVGEELQQKVFNDLSLSICGAEAINDLLRGRWKVVTMSFSEVRKIMSRIVHSSIMKINEYSMERVSHSVLPCTCRNLDELLCNTC